MTRRRKIWQVVAAIFTLVNLASVVYAAVLSEIAHAALHVALTVAGAYWMSRLIGRGGPKDVTGMPLSDDRIEQLQQSVDAAALEVERIGEAQRFHEKLHAEKSEMRR